MDADDQAARSTPATTTRTNGNIFGMMSVEIRILAHGQLRRVLLTIHEQLHGIDSRPDSGVRRTTALALIFPAACSAAALTVRRCRPGVGAKVPPNAIQARRARPGQR